MPDRPGSSSHAQKYLSTGKESRSTARPSDKPKSSNSHQAAKGSRLPTLDAGPSKLSGTHVSRSALSSRQPTSTTGSSSKPKGSLMPQLDSSRRQERGSLLRSALDSSRTRPEPSSQRIGSSIHATKHDQQMASRQIHINTMSGRELQEQEKWAQSKLTQAAGVCMDGFGWQRTDICENTGLISGYKCLGGGHFVSDESLAKGTEGCYLRALKPSVFDSRGIYPHLDGKLFAKELWYGPWSEDEIYRQFGVSKAQFHAGRMFGIGKQAFQEVYEITSSHWVPGPYPVGQGGGSPLA